MIKSITRSVHLPPVGFFLLGARLAFGLFLLYQAFSKIILGNPLGFVRFIDTSFDATWIPGVLAKMLALFILATEPLIGFWLVSGIHQRLCWTAATCLMFTLLLGQLILGKNELLPGMWIYVILCLGCSALCGPLNINKTC